MTVGNKQRPQQSNSSKAFSQQEKRKPRSEALRHWASAQSLTSAFFLLNGGLYSFAFPAALIRVPGFSTLYSPFSITGFMAVLLALVIVFVELPPERNGTSFRDSNQSLPLGMTYGICSLLLAFQYTLVVPCTFLLITSITLIADWWSLSRSKISN